jgi:hypothetical protein
MLLAPPIALLAVIGLAIAGGHRPDPADVAVAPRVESIPPASQAPIAAVERAALTVPIAFAARREQGTDGLMGRLPFGIADDSPLVHVERRDKFIIDDRILTWLEPAYHEPNRPSFRQGGLSNYRVDPYAR